MDLILWRHPDAEEIHGGGISDLERRLTAKGKRQAGRMAAWLRRHLPTNAHVLVSPAKRTMQTARALDRPFTTVAALAPGAVVSDVLAAARWPNASRATLVIGHQPVLGQVVAQLLSGVEAEDAQHGWVIRKGAAVWLRQLDHDAAPQVVLQAVQMPQLL